MYTRNSKNSMVKKKQLYQKMGYQEQQSNFLILPWTHGNLKADLMKKLIQAKPNHEIRRKDKVGF